MILNVCCPHCLEGGGLSVIFTAALVSVEADRWLQELVFYVHTDVINTICRKDEQNP